MLSKPSENEKITTLTSLGALLRIEFQRPTDLEPGNPWFFSKISAQYADEMETRKEKSGQTRLSPARSQAVKVTLKECPSRRTSTDNEVVELIEDQTVKFRCPCKEAPIVFWHVNGTRVPHSSGRFLPFNNMLKIKDLRVSDGVKMGCGLDLRTADSSMMFWYNFTVSVKPSNDSDSQDFVRRTKGNVEQSKLRRKDYAGDLESPVDEPEAMALQKKPSPSKPTFYGIEGKDWYKYQFLPRSAGGNLRISCKFNQTNPKSQITWLKNGNPNFIRLGKYVQREFSLYLQDLTLSDSANYTCIVNNTLGSVSRVTEIQVVERLQMRPLMTMEECVTLTVGENYTLECKIISDLPISLNWTFCNETSAETCSVRGERAEIAGNCSYGKVEVVFVA
ncbi:unnamed protein product [Notodromas monacha]|uniref:Ig-like domain-containing protein n=1 Tax=Notodromas monacha TaxID=399045 RepID=A0A7R9GDG6_9CRUS|nr:unnamed protein product [Notodromas monacha]CAG0918519.1 unnamed protein product [Notodromas monacha]